MRYITRSLLILLTLLSPLMVADAINPFEVRIVYFRPLDASPAPVDKITNLMQETQEFYASEMERNGFGNKTFSIETVNNKMVVHTVDGAHNAEHYFHNTYQKMWQELPIEFRVKHDNINVFIVGGLDFVQSGGVLGIGWTFSGWRAGGGAVLPGDRLNMPIIAHEIGHAFGLFHNNVVNTMMGLHHGPILDYEIRWISKSHYFNDRHVRTDIPKFIGDLHIQSIDDNSLKLRFIAQSKSGLHQSKIIRERGGYLVIGSDNLGGEHDISEMDMPRPRVMIGDLLSLRIIDVNGNYVYKDTTIKELPEPIEKAKPNINIFDNKNVDLEEDKKDNPVDNECPGCRSDENDKVDNTDLGVSYRNKLTIQWARLKTHR